MNLTQSNKSVLALVFSLLFLITGRLFVWKPDKTANTQQSSPQDTVAEQIQTDETVPYFTTEVTTFTTTEETPTTTVTTPFSRFELVPPDYIMTYDPDSSVQYNPDTVAPTESTVTAATQTTAIPVTTAPETEPEQTDLPQTEASSAPAGYFSDALFIGDSRMVGIASYSPIEGATYFATVGLSSYKIDSAVSEIEGTKNQTFTQVLNAKKYGKVYLMLGINELGMDFGTTMQNMDNIIAQIQKTQPGAKIILMANLHVAAHRHYNDGVVNNTQINSFNALLAAKADNQKIFYLDVNPIFDDENGCLKSECTSDDTHPYAKYYVTWSEWLQSHVF